MVSGQTLSTARRMTNIRNGLDWRHRASGQRPSGHQEDLLVVFLLELLPRLQAQALVALDGGDLRRQRLSLVTVTDTALLVRTVV